MLEPLAMRAGASADGAPALGYSDRVGKVIALGARAANGPARVRLRLTRGMWRIDMISLVRLGRGVEPVRVTPFRVRRSGAPDPVVLAELTGRHQPLVTTPGDAFDLDYRLPRHPDRYELFLETRGYYLEWMRQEWLAEEDPVKAARLLFVDPKGMLRTLAPAYKATEPRMDSLFWNSRYARTLR